MGIFRREVCLAVASALLTATPVLAQTSGRLQFAPAEWKTAKDPQLALETATLTVPENRLQKSTRRISVAVVRFRGTSTNNVPLVYVSGGSGAGISAAQGPRLSFFLSMRDLGDVVVFDLRGAGRSEPRLSCDESLGIDMTQPLSRPALVHATREVNRRCAASLRSKGFDLAGYNGREVVDDIEDLRKGLGAERIRLMGTSTGTHLALEYIRRYPRRVASAYLAGTEGPGQTAHLPADLDATLTRFAARTPDNALMEQVKGVIDMLDASPATVDVKGTPVRIGGYDARVFVASTLGDRQQMSLLPKMFAAMKASQFGPMAALKVQALRAPFQSPWESLHDCQAGTARSRQAQVAPQAATALLGYATLDFEDACDGWGVPELAEVYRTPVKSSVPALFISGSLDGRTPPTNAEEVRTGFARSAHLIIDGASHGDDLFLATPEIVTTIKAFTKSPNRATRTVAIAPPNATSDR